MRRMHRKKRSPITELLSPLRQSTDGVGSSSTSGHLSIQLDPVKRYKPLVVLLFVSSSSFPSPIFAHTYAHGQPFAHCVLQHYGLILDPKLSHCNAPTEANISERPPQLHGLHGLHVRYRQCDRTGSAALGTFFFFFLYTWLKKIPFPL